MSTRLRTVAVVLAGGTGSRVGLDIPKQLIKIAGKTIIEHTLDVLQDAPDGRRDHRDDGAGPPRRGAGDRPDGGYDKVTPDPRGRPRPATSTTRRGARRARRRGVQRAASTTPSARCSSQRIITECFEALETLRRGRRRDPVGRHDHPGRRRSDDDPRRSPTAAASCAAARPRRRSGSSVIRRAYEMAGQDPRLHRHRRLHRRAALPARRADLGGPRRGAEHEGHRADRRLPRRQAVPARPAATAAGPQPPRSTARRSTARRRGVRRQLRHRRRHRRAGRASTARPSTTFSRSTHRHPRRAARGRRGARAEQVLAEHRPDRLRRQHRRHPAARRAAGDHRGDDLRRHRGQLPRAGLHRPGRSSRTCAGPAGSLLLFTSSSYTRGRGGYSLYSSAKAAVVNLTQALADEWAADGVRVNCVNPERTGTPMRTKAFGEEPAGSLLVVRGGRAGLARRADLRPDRARHRRAPGRAR